MGTSKAPKLPEMDSLLSFDDASTEAAYRRASALMWTHWDRIIFVSAIFAGFSRVLNPQTRANPYLVAVHFSWFIILQFVCPSWFLATIARKRESYLSNRSTAMTVFRFIICIGEGLAFFAHDPLMWNPSVLLVKIMSQTSATSLLFSSFHRLPFRNHIWVQALSTILSFGWVVNLCEGSGKNQEIERAVNNLGWATGEAVTRIFTLGFPISRNALSDGQYSCWVVGFFYHIWLGFFVPTAIAYTSECVSRVEYIRRMNCVSQDLPDRLSDTKNSRLAFVGIAMVVGTQVLWFCLNDLYNFEFQCTARK